MNGRQEYDPNLEDYTLENEQFKPKDIPFDVPWAKVKAEMKAEEESANVPKWALEIQEQNAEINAGIVTLQVTLTAILNQIDGIVEQVAPLIETVSKHPMMKMFGVK